MYVAYGKKPLTKSERANNVMKKGVLYKYSETAQKVLSMLLEKYQDTEIEDLSDSKILELKPFDQFGSPMKIVKIFGGLDEYEKAVNDVEKELYAS